MEKRKMQKPKEGNTPYSHIRTLAIVLEGSCKVINQADGFEALELRQGNHFGASDVLRIPDIEYLGDIVAGHRGVKLLIIKSPDQVL